MSIAERATEAAAQYFAADEHEVTIVCLLVAILDTLSHDVDCDEHMGRIIQIARTVA